MPKRHYDGRRGGRKAKSRRRHHLYLVMDDDRVVSGAYAIRRMDLLSSGCDSDDDEEQPREEIDMGEQRLPPAQIRFKSLGCEFFAAIGTKIMVTYTTLPKRAVPVLDVRTRWLTQGPRPRVCPSNPIYVPVGDKLVAVDKKRSELLYPPPPEENFWEEWSWCDLPKPPFKPGSVTSHAAHPDGRTVFISVERKTSAATFTLDTESYRWKRHAEWKLPFTGRAHFDRGLDAWVGLSGDPGTLGHLCSCDVVSIDADADADDSSPAWKLSKEKLFCEDPAEEHIGASLVYMGGRSKFCLVQYFSTECDGEYSCDEEELGEELLQPRHYTLRLTTFTLKYDKKGDLVDTNRRIQCFTPRVADSYFPSMQSPLAFWM